MMPLEGAAAHDDDLYDGGQLPRSRKTGGQEGDCGRCRHEGGLAHLPGKIPHQ
jgi:hypothetical protein